MKFNICLVQPEAYVHTMAFLELGELIYFSLKDLGFDAGFGFNHLASDATNIIIGCHLLDPSLRSQLSKSTIIVNTEQIYSDTTDWIPTILDWARHFETWDYSQRNIERFKSLGINGVKYLEIGFQKELVRLDRSKPKDIDVLFYGSLNARRIQVLESLEAKGLEVKHLFGVYGKERDSWIERSKVVLNCHLYDSQIFEKVRVFYLMTNAIAVVGEVGPTTSIDAMCKAGIYATDYDGLVEGCMDLVYLDSQREKVQQAAFDSISKYPQSAYTAQVLGLKICVALLFATQALESKAKSTVS